MTKRALGEILLGMVGGFAFIAAACATLTDPPSNWPKAPTCAQDPNQDGCFPPVHDRLAPDGGK